MSGADGSAVPNARERTVDCEVCILGAGVAGLNALFAATRHLSSDQPIVIVDRTASPAGMWNRTYNYVRLHQPHPTFTAGNISWRSQRDPYYLATRTEVVEHLNYCFETLSGRSRIDPHFGYEYVNHEDKGTGDRPVTVHCRRASDDQPLTIRARRLIKAFGYDVKVQPALALSSQTVQSLSPDLHDLTAPEVRDSDGSIYIVGGGKTGMDTAHLMVRQLPHKRVRMLAGAGTIFANRDLAHPRGLRRYWGGVPALEAFLDTAARFDGRNEAEVMAYFLRRYGLSLGPDTRSHTFGVLSPVELSEIGQGLDEVIMDHLVDVVDESNSPTMVLRSGQRRSIEPGSIIINATGYLLRENLPYEPLLSASGNVISIQPTSAIHFLSSQAAYFLTHLFLMGELDSVPLYEVDGNELARASRVVLAPAAMSLTLYNSWHAMSRLPRWAARENGLDFLLLYPTHRRLLAFARLFTFMKRRPTHFTDVMDIVRDRFEIRLGPFKQADSGQSAVRKGGEREVAGAE